MQIKLFLKTTLLLIATFLFIPFCFAENNSNAALKQLLLPLRSMQGNFQQKVLNEKGALLQQQQGQMWLQKPGCFRWEIKGQDKHLVVSNGKQIWDYDPELEQVSIQKMLKNKSTAPIYFLTGDDRALDQNFKVVSFGKMGKCMRESDTCFELHPRSITNNFQSIRIGFKNKILKEMELLDQLGQYSQFVFSQMILNKNIPENMFNFTPPKGVDILRN